VSVKALSLATISFSARTSCMVPSHLVEEGRPL
jgi:hypothetical protein